MRIHRIHLRNYRGVTDRQIAFEPCGVTIVEGGNEVGKSSIAEALNLLFEEYDDTTKARVRSVKPVGNDVGAEIEAEISAGEYRFVYSKRWHRDRFTKLEIVEPRREQLEGRPAHDRVKCIIDETVDEALWRALRIDQDASTEQPVWGSDSSLTRALDLAAGVSDDSRQGGDLFARVCEERAKYWTSTGKPNADRAAADRRVVEAKLDVEVTSAALASLDADVRLHEDLTRELGTLRGRQVDITKERDFLADLWSQIEKRKNEVARLSAAADAEAASLALAQGAQRSRDELIADLDRRREDRDRTGEELSRSEPALDAARRTVDAARAALGAARTALGSARSSSERAAADCRHLRDKLDRDMLTERCNYVVDAEQTIRSADEALAGSRVDGPVLEAIEGAHVAVTTLRASLEASAGVIRTEAVRGVSLRVGGETIQLCAGDADERQLAGELELQVDDSARIIVTPGGDARSLGEKLEAALLDLERLCQAAEVKDAAAARRAHGDRELAVQERESATRTRDQHLRDLTLGELAGKIERLEKAIAEYAARRDTSAALPAELSSAQRLADDAEALQEDAESRVGRSEELLAVTERENQRILRERSGLSELLKATERELSDSAARLDSARRDQPDENLAAKAASAGAAAESAAEALDVAERTLAQEDPESVRVRFDNAKLAAERAAAEIRDREDDLNGVQARLEVRCEDGLQHRLDDAKTLLVHSESERDRLEARAAAAKLLYDTMSRHRDAAKRRYVAPFREKIENLARVVFGPSLEVELDDDLRIVGRTLDGLTLAWQDLSFGAREQLAVIARLACAAIVSSDGGVPVIFDDTLGSTDPGRLERMGAVLSAASGDSQVIVLTCMPDRYRHVGAATVVRITD